MVNPSRDKGTAFTTAVIRYLQPHGFPHAELRNQAGSRDKGDIVGLPGIAIECKGGRAAETASDAQVLTWLAETETERRNAGADIGLLVLKRKAVGATNAGRWWTLMTARTFAQLVGTPPLGPALRLPDAPVRLHLADAVRLVRAAGYGTALDEAPVNADEALRPVDAA